MNNTHFHIYNASAGSGKTYTLVKAYLKVILNSPFNDSYKNALAITFTNKAVSEMKTRIIKNLKEFANPEILNASNSMFIDICKDLQSEPLIVHKKSKKVLESIIYNYAAFDISTIDKFTQKLIRTFAYDLQLPINFEVELDTDTLLNKAVNNLIAKAGNNTKLTKTLIDFAIEKTDDDKSWDITTDFFKASKLLLKENDAYYLNFFEDKSLEDFETLKSQLLKQIHISKQNCTTIANKTLEFITECGLQYSDFTRSSLPNFFSAISKQNFDVTLNNQWQLNIETQNLYPKKTSSNIASIIDDIQPQLAANFKTIKQHILQLILYKAIYKELTPLSVLNAINAELNTIKEDENLLLISEFNTIISKEIKEQPAPFIYERIGEKFKHYFIDEFQDTSILQWENLIPLLDNALASQGGSALIVGDAKQAIYRWRGGKAEQFIALCNNKNPFQAKASINNLPKNYRSYKTIIEFNNSFFQHLSTFAFRDESYKNIYELSHQDKHQKHEGYVNISFIEPSKEDDKKELYAQHVLKVINSCLDNGFKLSEICVLVRYYKDGVVVSEYLNDNNIDIVSSETLLVNNALEVRFIINLLEYLTQPENELAKIKALTFIANHTIDVSDKHEFLVQFVGQNLSNCLNILETYDLFFNDAEFHSLPLYEAIEYIIYSFNLTQNSNAYLQFFLDFVLDFSQNTQVDILSFLEHYNLKKDKLSIISSGENDAVKIMTIHKSKGLEFPVVIVPFADISIYYEKEAKVWYPLKPEAFNDFDFAHINFNSTIEDLSEVGAAIYNHKRAEQELDTVNLLYVALTRAVEQLYIVSEKKLSKGVENLKTFSGFFINYLKAQNLWSDTTLTYHFGNAEKTSKSILKNQAEKLTQFITVPKKEHNLNILTVSGNLWNTKQEKAIEKGNLVHYIMSKINTIHDIPFVFKDFIRSGEITTEQEQTLKPLVISIVNHELLKPYFNSNILSYNEHDIIAKTGKLLRPDKLVVLPNNKAVLIDYKTGKHLAKYEQQLDDYQNIIEDMNLKVIKKILVYINDDIQVKEV